MKVVLAIILFFPLATFSQLVNEYPVSFLSTSFNTFMYAKEIRDFDNATWNISTYARKNTGLFSDVYQITSQLGYSRNSSTISALFYTDQQGELISRNRMYIQGNTRISLAEKHFGFLGLSAGLVSKSLGNQQTTSQGTASVFDASAILGVYSKRYLFSFAVMQIPQNAIIPIHFEVPLLRYYQIYANVQAINFNDISIGFVGIMNMYQYTTSEIIGGVSFIWKSDYSIGVELSNYNVANYFIECKALELEKTKISFMVGYETSHLITSQLRASFSILNSGVIIKIK